jgi:hypothetical protein
VSESLASKRWLSRALSQVVLERVFVVAGPKTEVKLDEVRTTPPLPCHSLLFLLRMHPPTHFMCDRQAQERKNALASKLEQLKTVEGTFRAVTRPVGRCAVL